jgi:glycosyltransferase involved in cell wall biosynthesis
MTYRHEQGNPMEEQKRDLMILILGKDVSRTIASTIQKIRLYLENELHARYRIVWLDNGSTDETEWFAKKAGAFVVKYTRTQPRERIVHKAVEVCLQNDRPISIILDTEGGNTADDAISLHKAAIRMKDRFVTGWIVPVHGSKNIGCLALDRDSLRGMYDKGPDIYAYLQEKLRSKEFMKTNVTEEISGISKLKRSSGQRVRNLREWFRDLRRVHALKFYGGIGVLVVIVALASGFYTVDYFYRNQNLYYPTAFLTVALTMIGGFLMVAGMMLNAMNVMVSRIRSEKKWERASREIRKL